MASLKSDPATQFSNAAYILFYRRRSTTPLGGPRFKDLFTSIDESIDQADGCSVSSSRADSPSGEGQRLEDSSRGFSSAYQEVGVVHQAGNGGLQDIQRVTTRNMVRISQDQVDDDPILPDYDEARHPFPTMEIDDPALISTIPRWNDSNWSFGALPSNQSSNRADDDYSMTGNDAYSDRGHNLVLADGLFGRSNYSGQPGTPDDDNDSMHVGADADSDIEHLEDEGTDIKVIDSSHASRNWGGGHDDAERDEEDVHEIHA